jgi:glycosyltransferase involved in cell wall biosynthesis
VTGIPLIPERFHERQWYIVNAQAGGIAVISVIIATHNSERTIAPTLANLVAGAAAGVVREVLVADGGSTDSTREIADLAGCEVVVAPAGLAARLNGAARRARASWLMFLRAGIVLDTGWIEEVARFIDMAETDDTSKSNAAVFRWAAPPAAFRSPLIDGLAALKRALGGPSADQGLLIGQRLHDQLGGHRDVADPEADLLRRLGRRRTAQLRTAAVRIGAR